jgi:signal transduction histidine kinase
MVTINSLVLGAIISTTISRFPLKPVNKIITQMNRLASGDFKARLEIEGPLAKHSAVKEVTDSFNRMAEELQSTEMLRSDFINNFSHEFKTPIVSIAGFAKLLRRGSLPAEKQEEYLAIIETESMRLSQMATNVLNLTKVENQTILTDVTEYNLSEQIRSCILLLSEKWEQKEIEYALDFNEYTIHANEELLKQVWINLLGNAVKFTPVGGLIEVRITEQEATITVSVRNTGSEIAPEHQERIFNKFYQADESHASEGNGIGLAIVKRVVELHEGEISVSSGNGSTTFTVTLPK